MVRKPSGDVDAGLLFSVFFVSFAAIAWQLALMRCLLIARYNHFSFLVISCALLGFGAGGTILSIARSRFERSGETVFRIGVPIFAVSIPVCFRLGEALPLNVYFPPPALWSALGWWGLFWIIHLVPFLCAGTLIGLALMRGSERVHLVYASNLTGSAAGALGGLLLLEAEPANLAAAALALVAIAPAPFFAPRIARAGRILYRSITLGAITVLVVALLLPAGSTFPLNIDQYKPLAYVQRLEAQGSAERRAVLHGVRGRIDLYSSPLFHTILSLGTATAPPRLDMVLQDGFQAGAVIARSRDRTGDFVRSTLFALPYRLTTPERVLILGADGGLRLALARLSSARKIVLVQPDPNVIRVLESHPSDILDDPRIVVVEAEPRAFLDTTGERFDIIHLAGLAGFTAGSAGIGGLRENYLATIDGFAECLQALTPRGLACVVRGLQEPARDNIRIAATWIEALGRLGVNDPGSCLLMARDELSMATMSGSSSLGPEVVRRFRHAIEERSLDPEWYPGIDPDRTNRRHVIPGPPDADISWYHYALRKILSQERESFYERWICAVRPATDDKPFFHDFFKWEAISRLRAAFGPMWPARSEMGFLMLVLTTAWTAAAAFVLLAAPSIAAARGTDGIGVRDLTATLLYFTGLGAAFMFLEMSFIQIFTRFVGDPVIAAAMIVGGFLFFAGIGSRLQPSITSRLPGGPLTATVLIAVLAIVQLFIFPWVFSVAGRVPIGGKVLIGLALIAPLALLMGVPFPWGMAALHRAKPAAVPIAWAANGFASVLSASLAVVIAMTEGFTALLALAGVIYILTGVVSRGPTGGST